MPRKKNVIKLPVLKPKKRRRIKGIRTLNIPKIVGMKF